MKVLRRYYCWVYLKVEPGKSLVKIASCLQIALWPFYFYIIEITNSSHPSIYLGPKVTFSPKS